jgi:uncharacterized protein DUF1566
VRHGDPPVTDVHVELSPAVELFPKLRTLTLTVRCMMTAHMVTRLLRTISILCNCLDESSNQSSCRSLRAVNQLSYLHRLPNGSPKEMTGLRLFEASGGFSRVPPFLLGFQLSGAVLKSPQGTVVIAEPVVPLYGVPVSLGSVTRDQTFSADTLPVIQWSHWDIVPGAVNPLTLHRKSFALVAFTPDDSVHTAVVLNDPVVIQNSELQIEVLSAIGGAWSAKTWTPRDKPQAFCRDKSAEHLDQIVLVYSSNDSVSELLAPTGHDYLPVVHAHSAPCLDSPPPPGQFPPKPDTLYDPDTGLMWAADANLMRTRDPAFKDPDGNFNSDGMINWLGALAYVQKLNTDLYLGYKDWRLPNIRELKSLQNYTWSNQDFPQDLMDRGFTNVPNWGYIFWSSTTNVATQSVMCALDTSLNGNSYGQTWVIAGPSAAWIVNYWFPSVQVQPKGKSGISGQVIDYSGFVWPVRGDPTEAQLPRTGQTKCYNDIGTEVGCSVYPGQDGSVQAGKAWPKPRFESAKANGVASGVPDHMTGLTWSADPQGICGCTAYSGEWSYVPNTSGKCTSFAQASPSSDYADCLNSKKCLNYQGWRLPTQQEMETLVNYGFDEQQCNGKPCQALADWLNGNGFTANKQFTSYWWSGDLDADSVGPTPKHWSLCLADGRGYSLCNNSFIQDEACGYAMAVRGGK